MIAASPCNFGRRLSVQPCRKEKKMSLSKIFPCDVFWSLMVSVSIPGRFCKISRNSASVVCPGLILFQHGKTQLDLSRIDSSSGETPQAVVKRKISKISLFTFTLHMHRSDCPVPPNGLRYPLVGGTRQRRFDGTNFKPRKLLENAPTPTSRVHAVLGFFMLGKSVLYS